MQLSKHFTLKEMTKSMTAQRKGIDNTPGSGEIKALGDLCYEVLEPLRAHFDKWNTTIRMIQQVVGFTYLITNQIQIENKFLLLMEKNTLKVFQTWNGRVEKLSDKTKSMLHLSLKSIDTVVGHCENCEEDSVLVSVVTDYYRCTNCGNDTRQHVNGSIRYLKLSENDKEWLRKNPSSE